MTVQEMLQADFGTIPALIRQHAKERPDRIALALDGREISYREFDRLIDRIVVGLQRDCIKPRESVAVCAANSPEYAAVFFGALRAGAVIAPLSQASTQEGLLLMLADSGARHFFIDREVEKILQMSVLPTNVKFILLDDNQAENSLENWLPSQDQEPAEISALPEDPFNIIYSSGTTAAPKGIVQPNVMRWAHVRRAMHFGYDADAISIISTPLHSNTTLVCFLPTIACGGTAVLMQKFDVADFLALAEKARATHTMLVPSQYRRIMQFEDFDRYDLSSFRVKFSTSAPFSATLKTEVLARWPGGLMEYYGQTEGGGTCILLAHENPDKLHTVGKPVHGHDMRLIGEDGKEVPSDEAGEVVGRSTSMMTGYRNHPEMTAAAEWFDGEGRRFIRTGDIGRFDEDGFLTLIDRKKDIIISGGFNIYSSDLEAALVAHEAVAEAAVIAAPCERWGETPAAFVVLKPGRVVIPEELLGWVNQRLGKVQRISEIRIVPEFPRSPIGKVLKRELRDVIAG